VAERNPAQRSVRSFPGRTQDLRGGLVKSERAALPDRFVRVV